MKRLILIVSASVALLLGCNQVSSESDAVSFSSIEISRSDGWHDYFCVHIDSLGNLNIEQSSKSKSIVKHYTGKLDNTQLTQLSALVDSIGALEPDSIDHMSCIDCPYYFLTIRKPGQQVNFTPNDNEATIYLTKLADYFTNLVDKNSFPETDTTFTFPTFERLLPPPADTMQMYACKVYWKEPYALTGSSTIWIETNGRLVFEDVPRFEPIYSIGQLNAEQFTKYCALRKSLATSASVKSDRRCYDCGWSAVTFSTEWYNYTYTSFQNEQNNSLDEFVAFFKDLTLNEEFTKSDSAGAFNYLYSEDSAE